MRQRTRKWLLVLVGLVAFGSLCMLVGLRSGRPLFYTDGFQEWFAPGLADAPMLAWGRPEPELELPGPVQGRVEELPDGRLIYGREQADGTTDLVVFDPRRPGLPPEPALGVNSRDHDLAPAMGPNETLYFASDRAGGEGGFDLYMARYAGGVFSPAVPLGPDINTSMDEADPAPDPTGETIVFVRRDPAVNEGANSLLYTAPLEVVDPAAEAELVLPFSVKRDPFFQPMDRDPHFSPDGVNLWFVRSYPNRSDAPPEIVSTWRHDGVYAGPVVHEVLSTEAGLRSPTARPGGRELRLVRPGEQALLYVSRAQGLYPWWPGQRSLELLLLAVLLSTLVILVLLVLGQRWTKLDVITQCLLLSLLLHLILLYLLAEKEIVRRFEPDLLGEGTLEIELISGDRAASEGGGELAQMQQDLSAQSRFEPEQRDLAADAPAAELEAERVGAQEAPARMAEVAEPQQVAEAASMQDAAAEMELRSGEDAQAALDAQAMQAATAQQAEMEARPVARGVETIRVTVPVTAPQQSEAGAAAAVAAAPGARPTASPLPREVGASTPQDAPTAAMPLRSGAADDSGAVSAAETALAAASLAAAPAAERATSSGTAASEAAAPAAATAVQPTGPRPAPLAQTTAALPQATQASGEQQALRDAAAASGQIATPSRAGDPAVSVSATNTSLRGASAQAATSPTRSSATADRDLSGGALVGPQQELVTAGARRAPPVARGAPPQASSAARAGAVALRDTSAGAAQARPTATGSAATSVAMADRASAVSRQQSGYRATRDARTALRAGSDADRGEPPTGVRSARSAQAPRQRPSDLPRARQIGGQPSPKLADAPRPTASRSSDGSVPGAGQPTPRAALGLATPLAAAVSRPARGRRVDLGSDTASAGIQPPGSLMAAAPRRQRAAAPPTRLVSTPYSNRFGPAKAEALQRFGGTDETERAVADGLRYLASIQRDDGHWGSQRLRDEKYGEVHIGKTGLCLLAFLGAGHSPSSDTEYSDVAERALEYLIAQQDDDTGAIGFTSAYSHGISTFAMVECYGMTKDQRLLDPIEKALNWILENQSPRGDRRNRGGWGYFSGSSRLRPEDRFARSSITVWMIMALESARMSGIQVSDQVLTDARDFLRNCFDREEGYYRYNHNPSRLNTDWPTLPASTPASAFALMILGEARDDYRVRSALDYTVDRRPTSYRRFSDDQFVLRAAGNVYFWYYGSLACFMAGGDVWEEWNEALSTIIPRAQSEDGSFRPIDVYSEYAGDTERDRSYTTAMCVLSLEVYYRYFTPLLGGR